MNKLNLIVLQIVLAACVPAYAGGDFRSVARELASAAQRHHVGRIAVFPFIAMDRSSPNDGWNISERLLTQLVRTGHIETVERSLLQKVVAEHHLASNGMFDAATLKRLGRIFPVDGIVTGSFATLSSGKAVINARLINVENGVIVAACEAEVDREGFGPPNSGPGPSEDQLVEVFALPSQTRPAPGPAFLPLAAEELDDLKDAVATLSCGEVPAEVDRLERSILDVKTRFMALQLKKGLNLSAFKDFPGADITDPGLKQEFYDRIRSWYKKSRIPELSAPEFERLLSADFQALTLAKNCAMPRD